MTSKVYLFIKDQRAHVQETHSSGYVTSFLRMCRMIHTHTHTHKTVSCRSGCLIILNYVLRLP